MIEFRGCPKGDIRVEQESNAAGSVNWTAQCRSSSDRGPARCAEVAGDATRGLDHSRAELLVAPACENPLAWADDPDCADGLGAAVEDRRGDAALSEHGLLLLEGVAALSHRVEVTTECRRGDEGLAGQLRGVGSD